MKKVDKWLLAHCQWVKEIFFNFLTSFDAIGIFESVEEAFHRPLFQLQLSMAQYSLSFSSWTFNHQ